MTSVDMLTTVHDPYDARIHHKEARTLADAGYDVSIIAHHPRAESVNGVDIVPIGTAGSRIERWAHLYRMYRTAAVRGSDVYHFHDPELLPVGMMLARTTDAAVIYDVHEDYENAVRHRNWIPDALTPTLSRGIPAVQSACSTQFDAVITATEWIAEQFQERGHANVTPVRNFPITENISIGDPPEQPEYEHTLVYVGSISETRGAVQMLRLVRELREREKDVGLWILGHFINDSIETSVRTYIRDNDLDGAIRLFGRVDHESVFSYLSAADIGLVLADADRYRYVIPTKIFEYMTVGLPVLSTDTLGPREYLPESAGVFVNESDTERQADLVEELLDDPDKMVQMGQAGRARVTDEYCWERESEKLLTTYSKLTR